MSQVVLVDQDEVLRRRCDHSLILELGRTGAYTVNCESDYLWGRSWPYLQV
jgi:hypothetical protein